MRVVYIITAIVLGCVFGGCGVSDTSSDDDGKNREVELEDVDKVEGGPKNDTYTSHEYYVRSRDTVYILHNDCRCRIRKVVAGDSVEYVVDSETKLVAYVFVMNDDTLWLRYSSAYLPSSGEDSTVVTIFGTYERLAGRAGELQGLWKWVSMECLYDGTLTAEDHAALEPFLQDSTAYPWLFFEETRITKFTFVRPASFADAFLKKWERNYAAKYNVAVVKMDESNVVLVGNVTGDTVFVREDEEGNVNYTSSSGEYSSYTWYLKPNPENCPNDEYPRWLSLANKSGFLVKNLRTDQ